MRVIVWWLKTKFRTPTCGESFDRCARVPFQVKKRKCGGEEVQSDNRC
jgi:hypothetical protein